MKKISIFGGGIFYIFEQVCFRDVMVSKKLLDRVESNADKDQMSTFCHN